MVTDETGLSVIRDFALALDREDYVIAKSFLATECIYQVGFTVLRGPDEIIASYRSSSDWAAANIESITYESSVGFANNAYVVVFVDYIRHGGKELIHTSQQKMMLNASMKISYIEHRELPGERESLRAFFSEMGIHYPERETFAFE